MKLGNWARLIRHWIWVAPLILGVVFVAGGIFMMVEGRAAHNDVRDSIVQESATRLSRRTSRSLGTRRRSPVSRSTRRPRQRPSPM